MIGHGECIDCGEYGPLILPERFPHICSRCLFPPAKATDGRGVIEGPALPQTLSDRLAEVTGGVMPSYARKQMGS